MHVSLYHFYSSVKRGVPSFDDPCSPSLPMQPGLSIFICDAHCSWCCFRWCAWSATAPPRNVGVRAHAAQTFSHITITKIRVSGASSSGMPTGDRAGPRAMRERRCAPCVIVIPRFCTRYKLAFAAVLQAHRAGRARFF